VSTPPNPLFDPPSSTPKFQAVSAEGGSFIAADKQEDPPWSGWDVLALACMAVIAIFVSVVLVTFLAQRIAYPRTTWLEVAKLPGVVVLGQLLGYLFSLATMYMIVMRHQVEGFWTSMRWNWPQNGWTYVTAGVILSLGLQLFAHLLPIPKHLPMDEFFRTAHDAYLLSVFGMTVAPLMEELFFRGFLYPVLARRWGFGISVFVTALAFAMIHDAQLKSSWGPVLVIFIVGLVLTVVRATTRSLAASVLIHIAYNGTISAMLFVATGGFRHLERLHQ
jgi:uncharacterized protein